MGIYEFFNSFVKNHSKMKHSIAWTILIIAGFFETGWAIGMKYSDGFSKLWPSVFTAISMLISVVLLTYSLKVLPVGSAYAVWTGIGAVGTVILGIILFKEPYDLYRMFFIFLIIIGIVGLRVFK
jgi:quaternary ammonium compound-resistance protein SugE